MGELYQGFNFGLNNEVKHGTKEIVWQIYSFGLS